ncbi:RAMP superfamily CRISPR-associated protein [Saccharolobus sp. E5-1-F]|uniref:RAMP superfamily CRISPR-associated protein n=1 Tax=Saccharolobus sp. E5-1-F TaxID=2663019 RepID=UPI001386D308|nr:RAMP superfamily CRISPR-associated protein [Sulfolobus sp. E5-1-F]
MGYKCVNYNTNEHDFQKRDKYDEIYKIYATFKTVTPVCTCSGNVKIEYDRNSHNVKVTYLGYRVNGKPAIMGSSLKGALRTYALMLSDEATVKNLFGTNGFESLLYFKDIVLTENYVALPLGEEWTPKKSCDKHAVKVYIYRYPKVKSTNIYFEAIPKNKKFSAEIIAINVSIEDLKLLLASMGAKKYGIKIGRGKEKGYGIIKLDEIKIESLRKFQAIKVNELINDAQKIIDNRVEENENLRYAFFD